MNKEKFKLTKIHIMPKYLKREFKINKNDNLMYLEKFKKLLNIPNDIEKCIGENKSLLSILDCYPNNYIITNDIFIKMILIYYRINANIPVILMGDAGIGKLSIVIKLNQFLNNGEKTIQIIDIHPCITDIDIGKRMKDINEKAKLTQNETWVYFVHINTCSSFSLIKEVFVNRTFNGEKLNDKIRLIGSCYPYMIKRDFKEIERKDFKKQEFIYNVKPFPSSFLYFIFNFSLKIQDEKKCI